ncbi:MAG: hypothetical protein HUJ26_13820 [Planctomycetaceae bacterium]|nr:hypothetical protein [Planctomycetaceae bacterium]
MRPLLLLSVLSIFGCAAPFFGPDKATVKSLESIDVLVVVMSEEDQLKTVTITDSSVIEQFSVIYQNAKWKPYFATMPISDQSITGYSNDREQFRLALLKNRFVQNHGDGDLREGVFRTEDRNWLDNQLLNSQPSSTIKIEFKERNLREHGGVI